MALGFYASLSWIYLFIIFSISDNVTYPFSRLSKIKITNNSEQKPLRAKNKVIDQSFGIKK